MRKSPTSPWQRSIPSIKKPWEHGNWAYNLPTVAVAVAVDMAAVAAVGADMAVAADTEVAADMAAVADMAAAAGGMADAAAGTVAVAGGIEVVAAAAAASAGAAAMAAAAAACLGAVAGRPARFDLHNQVDGRIVLKAGSHHVGFGFFHGVQNARMRFLGHINRPLDRQHLGAVAGREAVCLCSGSWRPKRDEDAACYGVASLTLGAHIEP
jgi:hypothetical protein